MQNGTPPLPLWLSSLIAIFIALVGTGGLIGWYQVWQHRKKEQAETRLTDSQTDKTDAETEKIKSEMVSDLLKTASGFITTIDAQYREAMKDRDTYKGELDKHKELLKVADMRVLILEEEVIQLNCKSKLNS